MNRRAIAALVRRDLKNALQNKGVTLPMVILPLLMLVIFPLIFAIGPSLGDMSTSSLNGFDDLLRNMPAGMKAELVGLSEPQMLVTLGLVYFLAPMYLIIPVMVASVVAADSFAGERERKTLEALLYTPTTDSELFLAKVLSAGLPAVGVAWVGFILYALVGNVGAWPVMGRIFFPTPSWVVLVLFVVPAAAILGLGVMVIVSARVQTFQEAYQLGGMVVLPIVLLMFGQVSGVMYFSVGIVALLGLALWLIDVVLLWFGVRTFRRSELFARL